MADFCNTCARASFGGDTIGDLARLMPAEAYTAEVGALALCECCGPIVVDINGERMSKDVPDSCQCEAALKGAQEARRRRLAQRPNDRARAGEQ